MKIRRFTKVASVLTAGLLLASCRGQISEKPAVHPNMNMDQQPRMEAQEENRFYEDGRSMRNPVEGTVHRGGLREDPVLYEGINEDSSFVEEVPFEMTRAFLKRGQQQYEIYCTPCHGGVGDGAGIIMEGEYGFVPPPSFHDDRIRELTDGELYSAIANGIRTMPSYAHQVKVEDRWAIVGYIRALQRSQNVEEDEMDRYDVDLAALQQEFADAAAEEAAAEEDSGEAEGEVSAERGEELLGSNGCNACHSVDGRSGIGPTFQDLFGSERVMEDGTELTADEEYIRESIVEPQAKIVEGYDPIMQPFSHLSDDEIDSMIEYFKSISDN